MIGTMNPFTEPEAQLLSTLLAHFQVDIGKSLKHPDLTIEGRRQYEHDFALAIAVRTKLDALRSLT